MNQQHDSKENLTAPDYVSLSQMTLSESTDFDYSFGLTGYQLKLCLWGLFYLQKTETGIPQLDFPKSTWEKMRDELIAQIDAQGSGQTPDPHSDNHLDVMASILTADQLQK